jgi:hypothetical protein
MTSRVIETELDRSALTKFLAAQKPPFTVNVTKGRKRSLGQNKLQRLWLNEISEQLGDQTSEEIRGYCKLTMGVPILRAENEEFRAQYDKHVKGLPYESKLAFMMEPLDFPVSRLMTTKQKTQYLDEVCRHFAEQGLLLTQPQGMAA